MNSRILIGDLDQISKKALQILKENELKKEHPDVFWMEDEKLGVEQAKKIREFLSFKPYSAKGRAIVVLNADHFTHDGQNSLLKTLEEPPVNSLILLGAESDKKFLPTILSRCQITVIASDRAKQSQGLNDNNPATKQSLPSDEGGITSEFPRNDEIQKLINSSIESRFEFIEKLEDKDAFLKELVSYFHSQFSTPTSDLQPPTSFLEALLDAEKWNSSNGNIRAILEYLMLKMPQK
jgi:DNA polymerase III delta prime subunit